MRNSEMVLDWFLKEDGFVWLFDIVSKKYSECTIEKQIQVLFYGSPE